LDRVSKQEELDCEGEDILAIAIAGKMQRQIIDRVRIDESLKNQV